MEKEIVIKEDFIEVAVQVNTTINEFDEKYNKSYFQDRYKNSEKLILVAYINNQPVGYLIAYDKNKDGSFYCWMAGVNPLFRKKGVLKRMMEYLEKWAKDHCYNGISIKTRNNRREMLSYLIKAGFNFMEVKTQDNIKENRILLEKTIS